DDDDNQYGIASAAGKRSGVRQPYTCHESEDDWKLEREAKCDDYLHDQREVFADPCLKLDGYAFAARSFKTQEEFPCHGKYIIVGKRRTGKEEQGGNHEIRQHSLAFRFIHAGCEKHI